MIVAEGKIKGKQRPRVTRWGTYTPKDTVNYENWVRLCYQQQGGRMLNGEIKATIIAYFQVPKSYSKKRIQAIQEGKEYPCKKPDADNIAKVILDSLNKIAYSDDSQVTDLAVKKRWTTEKERVEFSLEEIRKEEE